MDARRRHCEDCIMLKVVDAFTGCAHCWVNSEEGGYYALAGHNVIVRCEQGAGCIGTYVSSDSDGLHAVFDYEEAERIADRVMKTGYINPDVLWDCVSVVDPNEPVDCSI